MPAQRRRVKRPAGSPDAPVRSVRVTDALWNKAKRRAEYEQTTMSHVLHAFVEGYAEGYLDMPKVQVVYQRPKEPQAS